MGQCCSRNQTSNNRNNPQYYNDVNTSKDTNKSISDSKNPAITSNYAGDNNSYTTNKANNNIVISKNDGRDSNVISSKEYGFQLIKSVDAHNELITSVCTYENSIISSSMDSTIKVFDKELNNVYTESDSAVQSFAVSDSGAILTSSCENQLFKWKLKL